MTNSAQRERADRFLALHHGPPILVLPNAWDAVSAKLFEQEGFQAVGTTSGGIAASLGYPDGERMTLCENLEVVRRIAQAVDIPVSADIEAGYGRRPEEAAQAARAAWAAGAVGINLEDSASGCGADPSQPLFEIADQTRRIAAIRSMAKAEGIPLVINARVDAYLTYLVSDQAVGDRLSETIQRAAAYLDAGADGIFVPDVGALDRETIGRLVRAIRGPLNVIAGATTPPLPELERLGVARVSFGPRPMRACLSLLRRMAREWKEKGTYATMSDSVVTYDEVNRWFSTCRKAGSRDSKTCASREEK